LKETDSAKARLAHENIERTEAANLAIQDKNEAVNALAKLDEVRALMNRLMGPNGSLTSNERQKYFTLNQDPVNVQ
jgi:hypothetical protein